MSNDVTRKKSETMKNGGGGGAVVAICQMSLEGLLQAGNVWHPESGMSLSSQCLAVSKTIVSIKTVRNPSSQAEEH